ncbi:MAG TPA: transglutaminase domain-containing protein [Polyangiaceae bacterium]|nr:transglutaminase domain-containing protein [Polyangiaceae bacterium]
MSRFLFHGLPHAATSLNTPPTSGAQSGDLSPEQRPAPAMNTVDTSVFLATVQVSADAALLPSQLRLTLRAEDGPFGELTRRGLAANVHDRTLLVRVPEAYPTSNDGTSDRYRQCSYVLDCDSASVAALGKEQLAANPSVGDLVSFVARYISSKSLSRGFDVASEVATSAEGDCSEHAVLLAALARRYRYAARVVFGIAVLRFEGRLPLLVGHAWVEIHDNNQWLVADAALAGLQQQSMPGFLQLHYLPVSVLEHEGVAFKAKLLSTPGVFNIERAASAEVRR